MVNYWDKFRVVMSLESTSGFWNSVAFRRELVPYSSGYKWECELYWQLHVDLQRNTWILWKQVEKKSIKSALRKGSWRKTIYTVDMWRFHFSKVSFPDLHQRDFYQRHYKISGIRISEKSSDFPVNCRMYYGLVEKLLQDLGIADNPVIRYTNTAIALRWKQQQHCLKTFAMLR